MAELSFEKINSEIDKITIPLYKRISKLTMTDKHLILLEALKLGFHFDQEFLVANLFDKFNLTYSPKEISNLIKTCKDELELEDFEQSLGKNVSKSIKDYTKLNGHQFEDWLKDLFEFQGYRVIRTKLSGDQGADLIINKDGLKTVVQAKKYTEAVSNKAVQEVVASKKHYNAEKAMVVTTGTFTRSAFELAKSNHVVMWDGKYLSAIVSSINDSVSVKDKGNLRSNQSTSFNKKENSVFIKVECPFCKDKLDLFEEEMPVREKTGYKECPSCHFELILNIPDSSYACRGCKTQFENISQRRLHEDICSNYKSRQSKCSHCNKEFTLDDSELKELKIKGKISVECPSCKKTTIVKK